MERDRSFVAYNVNVRETDAKVSKKIGSIVRSSGRLLKSNEGGKIRAHGMLPKVQGMGVTLEEMGISQVSMNLLDASLCPLHLAYKTCERVSQQITMLNSVAVKSLDWSPYRPWLKLVAIFHQTRKTNVRW